MKAFSIVLIVSLIAIIIFQIIGIVKKIKLRKKQQEQKCNQNVISTNDDIKSDKEEK